MSDNLKLEFYKFYCQKTPFYGVFALLLLMIYTDLVSDNKIQVLQNGFGASQWVVMILIASASTFIAMEYQNQTIVNLFYHSSHKWKIYLAKYLVLVCYTIMLLLFNLIFSLLLRLTMTGQSGNFLKILLLNLLGTFIYSLFMISLAFLMISWLQVNVLVIGLGILIGFLGATMSTALMGILKNMIGIIKWNPLNLIYIVNQLANPQYSRLSYLSNGQIILATLIYTIIFLAIGYKLFENRRV